MRTTKFLNYFNLIVAVVYLLVYLNSNRLYYDYLFIIGLVLTVWYNWETLKQIRGQRNRLNTLNYGVGISTILFGILLTLGSIGLITEGFQSKKVHLLMGLLYTPLGITTVLLTWRTLKYYKSM